MSDEWRVTSRRELLARGRSLGTIRGHLRRGELRRVAPGVFLEGPRLGGDDGWWQDVAIAVARDEDRLVTGQAAAALYGLDGFEPGVPIAVDVGPRGPSRLAGARRLERLDPPARVLGVWCTSPAETLVGLAADLAPRPGCRAASRPLPPVDLVELAVESALHRELVTVAGLRALCHRAGARRPGRATLAEVLARRPPQPPTESYLETRCVQVLRDADLPDFDRQVELSDRRGTIGRVDLHRDGVVIELVGRAWHLPRFGPDHRRYARLTGAGHLFLPFTFDDVEFHPHDVVDLVADALARRHAG